MNSRERLLMVLAGEIPDRVPVSTCELVGYNSQSFENQDPSYARLMEVIRQKTDCVCMWDPGWWGGFLASDVSEFVEVKQVREGSRVITKEVLHTPKGDLTQTSVKEDGVHTIWRPEHWCKSIEDVDKALSVPYKPGAFDFSDYPRISKEVGERGIIMGSLGDPLLLAADLMSFGEYTIWAMTEPDHFGEVVEIVHQRIMESLERSLAVEVLDLYRICGPEYATPPYLPPRLFERFVLPYVKEMVDLIHSKGGKVRLHAHGRIGEVLEMMLATGADALDPCEGPPDGDILLAETKRRVGGRACIFGNLQLKLLETGSAADVEAEVRRCMDVAKEGGGYVIMPTASPINTPLSPKTEENYLRFIETALECGAY